MKRLLPFCLFALSCLPTARAQEQGKVFVQTFKPHDYGAQAANWSAAQDKNGLLYFGNNQGLLAYDGAAWELIPTANQTLARALAYDSLSGTLYVGAYGDFGKLEEDKNGLKRYVSVCSVIEEKDKNFGDVWHIALGGGKVFFLTSLSIFEYDPKTGKIKAHRVGKRVYHRCFYIGGKLYFRADDFGLMYLENGKTAKVPGGEAFATEYIAYMYGSQGGKISIVSRNSGLYEMADALSSPKKTAAVLGTGVYHAKNNGKTLLTAALSGGVSEYRPEAGGVLSFKNSFGKKDHTSYFLFEDGQKNIWEASSIGISKIESGFPGRFFDEESGLEGDGLSLSEINGRILVGTGNGAFVQEAGRFRKINGISGQTWAFAETPDHKILIGNEKGLFYSENGLDARPVKSIPHIFSIAVSKKQPGTLWAAHRGGMSAFEYTSGVFKEIVISQEPLLKNKTRQCLEDKQGNMWFGTENDGLYMAPAGYSQNPLPGAIKVFGPENGLPSKAWNKALLYGYAVLSYGKKGVFVFLQEKNSFMEFGNINALLKEATAQKEAPWVYAAVIDSQNRLWMDTDRGKFCAQLKQADGRDSKLAKPLLKRLPKATSYEVGIAAGTDGRVWFANPEAVYVYMPDHEKPKAGIFQTLIREAAFKGDSVVRLAGAALEAEAAMPYAFNSVSFRFAVPFFTDENNTVYQYRLEGLEENWSEWDKKPYCQYTNLPEGDYTFEARGKNVLGAVGKGAVFKFRISPPTHRSWGAYAGYMSIGALIIWIIVKLNQRRLLKEKSRLELIVEKRTREIAWQNLEMQEKQKEMQGQMGQIKMHTQEIAQQKEIAAKQNKLLREQTEELQNAAENIKLLGELGTQIAADLDMGKMTKAIHQKITPLMDARSFGIGITENREIRFKDAILPSGILPELSIGLSAMDSLAALCVREGQEITLGVVGGQTNNHEKTENISKGLGEDAPASAMYCPIKFNGQTIGVLIVESSEKNVFTEPHLQTLSAVAAFIAIALKNANQSGGKALPAGQSLLANHKKTADIGLLAAGIAHELNHPINSARAGAKALNRDLEDLFRVLNLYNEIDAGNLPQKQKELSAIKKELGYAELPGEIKEAAKTIKTGVERAADILRGLREYSRKDVERSQKADLEENLEAALVMLKGTYKGKIKINRDYCGLPEIQCFPGKLNQVFVNMIDNAVQAMPDGGEITVKTELPSAGLARISISDTGTGIAEENLRKIFDPFFTTKAPGEGTGMGLAISAEIIARHKGEIRAESEVGKGTVFVIELPAG